MTALAVDRMAGVSFLPGETLLPLMDGLRAIQPLPSIEESSAIAPLKKKRDTKRIGDLSEGHVLLALTKAGYLVSKPFGENSRYDLVADDGVKLYRVQVKTGRLRDGAIRFNCYSSHAHRGGSTRPYFGEVDFVAVYCPETRKIYLIPESGLVATAAHLRVAPCKNGQTKMVRWAAQFELP